MLVVVLTVKIEGENTQTNGSGVYDCAYVCAGSREGPKFRVPSNVGFLIVQCGIAGSVCYVGTQRGVDTFCGFLGHIWHNLDTGRHRGT
jgi:hypothetical protein